MNDVAGAAMDDEPLRPSRDEIARVFHKAKKKGEAIAAKYRSITQVNESFYGGEQWSVLESAKAGTVVVNKNAWFDNEKVPRIAVNLFTGLLQTWSSLLTSDRPSVRAVPASDEPEDTYRAAFAQKVIEYVAEEVDSAQKIDEVVQLAGLSGTAGLKIVYIPDEDRVQWALVSVHDFLIDPNCEDWRNAQWVIFSDHISEDEAQELFERNGNDKKPAEKPYQNAANEELFGVEREEFWMRPTRDFPRGLYACFIDGECVEDTDYPYVIPDDSGRLRYLLPVVLMTMRRQRGSVYGNTNFTDAVPLQRAYNETVSRVQKLLRTTSSIHLLIPTELAEKFNPAEESLIKFPFAKADAAKAIDWTKPPQFNEAIFSQRDFFAQAMEQVVGLNSTTTGTRPRSLSGRAIEHLVELDHNRNADCTRSMETMIREAYRLTLALIRFYYTVPRQMKITNEDAMSVLAFTGADLDGVDVKLEPASEIDTLSSSKEQIAAERFSQGLATELDVKDAQRSPKVGYSRAAAEQMLALFKSGHPITELPVGISFDVIEDVIAKHRARALSTQDQGMWVLLDRFAKLIENLRARADVERPVAAEEEKTEGGMPQ